VLAAACAAAALLCIGATAAYATTPSPPPPPPSSGGGGGGGSTPPPSSTPQSTPTPPPADTQAPGPVAHLHANTKVPGQITLTWSNPRASDLAQIVVQRAWQTCPTSLHTGTRVGGTAVRRSQVDKGAANRSSYCYAVFAIDASGNASHYVRTGLIKNPGDTTAPGPVTGLTPTVNTHGQLVLSWKNPVRAGVAFIVVRRGVFPKCPTGRADGTAIGGSAVRTSQVDATAKPGVKYCYQVYTVDAAGNVSTGNSDANAAKPAPKVRTTPAPQTHASSSSGGGLTSMLTRMVAVVGLLMLLATAAATLLARRRTHSSAYMPAAREAAPRLAMTGVAPAALVIPALLVFGSCAAIVLVLLNL
jgi:hypothetical protein